MVTLKQQLRGWPKPGWSLGLTRPLVQDLLRFTDTRLGKGLRLTLCVAANGHDTELPKQAAALQRADAQLMFHIRGTLIALFPTSQTARPLNVTVVPRLPGPPRRPMRFLVPIEPVYVGCWESLKTLCTHVKRSPARKSIHLFRDPFVTKFELGGSRLLLSFLLHSLLVVTLFYLRLIIPAREPVHLAAFDRRTAIYYRISLQIPSKTLPRIAPAGPGARPGGGSQPQHVPVFGRSGFVGQFTIVSKPLHPDNFRQTIRQFASPPDLRMPQEMKLPDIVLGNLQAPRKPSVHFELNNARPVRIERQLTQDMEPAPELEAPVSSPSSLVPLSNAHPRMPLLALTAPRPILRSGSGEIPASNPDDVGLPGNGSGLVVLGVDPAGSLSQIGLPPGNRQGEFTISPPGGRDGSVGRDRDGVVGGGKGDGSGGMGSTGTGPGTWGGGGGESGSTESLMASGSKGGDEGGGGSGGGGGGVLHSDFIASMVYPVLSTVSLHKSPLVVSAGPMGGGGLNAYGALHCGKIYTVFLEMPGKNWTLQFCQQASREEMSHTQTRSPIVHLEEGLIPPYAESKFDFRRLPVPERNSHKLIVLKGVLREDGSVDKLEVYQGILPEMDEAARLALSRWKFKPATRAKTPVAVDILVGIPPESPLRPRSR